MRPAWKALAAHYEKVGRLHLRQLFAGDPARGERMTAEAVDQQPDPSLPKAEGEPMMTAMHLTALLGAESRAARPTTTRT
jgi:glucose-6-phosphate isomerase